MWSHLMERHSVVVKKWSIPCPLPHNITTLSDFKKVIWLMRTRAGRSELCMVSNQSDSECTPKLFILSIKSAYAIPTIAFSFLCHTAILPIYCELKRPTKTRMQNVANINIGLGIGLSFISALFGYLTFYSHVESELLRCYDVYLPRDVMVMTVRLAILLSVLLTVPLIHFPARKAVIVMLYGGNHFSWLTHIVSALIILGVVLVLAIFVPDIRNVFGVVGIFYLKISSQPIKSVNSIGAIILVVFGLIMGVASLTVIILSWVLTS
ncbi:hypothetical protein CCH79_00004403 [Gambusia affinis]|uniref:Amino acid transporter transmembrane domain-containing protein n=1 Tax=Gambusia affinis TaxID=33528 RepID=A0A315UZY1_GAMAF|nr:hypothetical protein CCH79_00004403 [Gambusia affinis]